MGGGCSTQTQPVMAPISPKPQSSVNVTNTAVEHNDKEQEARSPRDSKLERAAEISRNKLLALLAGNTEYGYLRQHYVILSDIGIECLEQLPEALLDEACEDINGERGKTFKGLGEWAHDAHMWEGSTRVHKIMESMTDSHKQNLTELLRITYNKRMYKYVQSETVFMDSHTLKCKHASGVLAFCSALPYPGGSAFMGLSRLLQTLLDGSEGCLALIKDVHQLAMLMVRLNDTRSRTSSCGMHNVSELEDAIKQASNYIQDLKRRSTLGKIWTIAHDKSAIVTLREEMKRQLDILALELVNCNFEEAKKNSEWLIRLIGATDVQHAELCNMLEAEKDKAIERHEEMKAEMKAEAATIKAELHEVKAMLKLNTTSEAQITGMHEEEANLGEKNDLAANEADTLAEEQRIAAEAEAAASAERYQYARAESLRCKEENEKAAAAAVAAAISAEEDEQRNTAESEAAAAAAAAIAAEEEAERRRIEAEAAAAATALALEEKKAEAIRKEREDKAERKKLKRLFYVAATAGDIYEVKRLVDLGVDLESKHSQLKLTALHIAAMNVEEVEGDHEEVMKFLISNGAIVNSLSHNNSTPLHDAAHFGRVGAVKVLLGAGANINAKNDKGQTPRTMARSRRSNDHMRIRELLDEYDPSFKRSDNLHEGETEEDFAKFIELSKKGLVVIDFYAAWCKFCVDFEPYWKHLAAEYPNVSFCRLICSHRNERPTEASTIARQLDVNGYPTFFLLRDKQKLGEFSGGTKSGYHQLHSMIKEATTEGKQFKKSPSLTRWNQLRFHDDDNDGFPDELMQMLLQGGILGHGGGPMGGMRVRMG